MSSKIIGDVSPSLLKIMNHLCELERKLIVHGDAANSLRNVQRIKDVMRNELAIFYEDPIGRPFKDTQTDVEATITGENSENLVVVEVIKPIIRAGNNDFSVVVQKGIVLVQSADEATGA